MLGSSLFRTPVVIARVKTLSNLLDGIFFRLNSAASKARFTTTLTHETVTHRTSGGDEI
jgi:hypothetical protein